MTAHLPNDVTRCTPNACRCKQRESCARANSWPIGDHIELSVVDASICLKPGSFCPMFIDRRGIALAEQAGATHA